MRPWSAPEEDPSSAPTPAVVRNSLTPQEPSF
jgi:hypothetical protein